MSRLNNESVRKTGANILSALTEAEGLKVNKVVFSDGEKVVKEEVLKEAEKPVEKEVCPKCKKEQCICKEASLTEDEKDSKYLDVAKKIAKSTDDLDLKEAMEELSSEPIFSKLKTRYRKYIKEAPEGGISSLESAIDDMIKILGFEPNEIYDMNNMEEESIEEPEEEPELTNDEKLAKAQELLGVIFDMEATDETRESAKAGLKSLIGEEESTEEPEIEPEEDLEERIVEGLEIVSKEGDAVLLKEAKGYIVGKDYNEKTGILKEAEEYKTETVAKKAFDRLVNKK